MDRTESDSPRRKLSNGGLGIGAILLVRRQSDVLSAYTGGPIQLYLAEYEIAEIQQQQISSLKTRIDIVTLAAKKWSHHTLVHTPVTTRLAGLCIH